MTHSSPVLLDGVIKTGIHSCISLLHSRGSKRCLRAAGSLALPSEKTNSSDGHISLSIFFVFQKESGPKRKGVVG